jgi:hypothetical protein
VAHLVFVKGHASSTVLGPCSSGISIAKWGVDRVLLEPSSKESWNNELYWTAKD